MTPATLHATNTGAPLRLIARAAAVLCALLLEIVIIDGSYSFSRAVAGEAPPMWRAANEALQTFIYVALYSSVAFGALTFAQRRDVISAWIESIRTHRWLPWFAAQCALFLVVMMMLPALQNGAARPPWFIFSMWLAASAGLVLCATLSLAPFSFWREQAQRQAGNLLAALIGGASVYAAVTQAKESWRELSAATLSASHWLLSLYEPGAFADAATRTLGARDFQVVIDAPCSGYEGIGLVLGVLGFYLFAFRRELRFPNALVLLPIGAVTIWALNAVRLSLLVSIGAHVSPTLALQGFHSQAGWIFFLLVTVSLMVIAHRTPALRAGAQATNATLDPAIGLAAALLIPFAALMAGRIFGAAFGPGPHWAGVLAIALPATALVLFRRDIGKRLSAIGFEPILLGVAVGGFWIATQAPSADGHALGRWLEAQPPLAAGAWLVLRAIGFVLIVPIAEELAFRGYLHRALIGKYFEKVSPHAFSVLAFVGTSVLFGALHQRWLSGTIAGAVFALALYRSRSLAGPIAAHIAANAVIACYAIIAEHWEFL